MNPANYKIRSGSSRATRGGVLSDIAKIFLYPTYVQPATNDFSLANLKKPLTFNDRTQPIALPPLGSYYVGEGEEVLVSGHGNTLNPLHSTEFLKGFVGKVMDFTVCDKAWNGGLTAGMICAYATDKKTTCTVCRFFYKLLQIFQIK